MEKEPKMGVDPKIKEEINKEGWEKTDDRDEQAVLIGKKEEMPQLLEKLETEGKTADLGSYIKLHKEIALPYDEITDEKLRQEIVEKKGDFDIINIERQKDMLEAPFLCHSKYIDKDGNMARVNIRLDKVADLKYLNEGFESFQIAKEIRKELEKLGFIWRYKEFEGARQGSKEFEAFKDYKAMWNEIARAEEDYKKKLEQEAKEREKEKFDF